MKTVYAGTRLAVSEKVEAEKILNDMGLTLANYIRMMIAQLRINRTIPAVSQYPTTLSERSLEIAEASRKGAYNGKGKTFASADDAISALGI